MRSARRASLRYERASDHLRVAGRRVFLLTAGSALALTALPSAFAQSIPCIGFIRHGSRDAFSEGFRQGLRDLGYIEGKYKIRVRADRVIE